MKRIYLLVFPIAIVMLSSCNNSQKSADKNTSDTIGMAEKFEKISSNCYLAVNGADSARLTLKDLNGKVEGEMSFNFATKEDNSGTFTGEFKGDTLFVEYSFKLHNSSTQYLNPQVFLKNGNKLAQGSGELFTYLGKTTFKEHSKINFENNFVFEPSDCK